MTKMNSHDAIICAQASEAIYGGQEAVAPLMESLGFRVIDWIALETPSNDVCVFVASSPDADLVCFRGTKVFQDWMTDLQSTPVRFEWIFSGGPTIGEVHAGFGHCLEGGLMDIKSAMDEALKDLAADSPGKPLIITGHSLGGALAAMLGACCTVYQPVLRPVSAIYTFGQPRIGLHGFCNIYDQVLQGKLVRFVNNADLVPRVPFTGWDYSDEGKMIHFDSGGNASIQSSAWTSWWSRTIQSFEQFADMITHLGVDIGDHNIKTYKDRLVSNPEQIDLLFAQF